MFYIYKILNKENNKTYIGSTFDFKQRKLNHINSLNDRTHPNTYLLKDWVKYGQDAFEFEIVLIGEDDKLKLKTEQIVIDSYKWNQLYNEKIAYDKLHKPRKKYNRDKKVKCLETDIIYNNVPEAAKALKLNQSHIHECAKGTGKRKTTGGYHWHYVEE